MESQRVQQLTGLQTRRALSSDWDGVSSDRAPQAVTRREKTRVELSLYQREDVGLCHALHVQFHLHSLSNSPSVNINQS